MGAPDAVDVVVEVGGWEHECCGEPIERNQMLDLQCVSYTAPDGSSRLAETHHGPDLSATERVRGRVVDIQVVPTDGAPQPVLRIPSGAALRASDEGDDGHLEDPWTGEAVPCDSSGFLVTVRTAHGPSRP